MQGYFADDFETDRGWTPSLPSDTQTGRWVRWDPIGTMYNGEPIEPAGDHTPAPGTMCYDTGVGTQGGSADGSDVDGGCVTLTSPVIDLSNAQQAFVSYWRWFALEVSLDGLFAALRSTDGGTTWSALETLGSTHNSWTQASFNLGALGPLTSQMRFRFVVCDTGSESLCEGAVDDFLVSGIPDVTGVEPSPPATPVGETALGPNRPNPFSSATALRFSLAKPGPVSLAVYDAGGRCVRTLHRSVLGAGEHTITWDGRSDSGVKVGAGVYFYELKAEGFEGHRKMLRVE